MPRVAEDPRQVSLRVAPSRIVGRSLPREPGELPLWPPALAFLGTPLWWLLGIGDITWILLAAVMVYLLARRGRVEVPRGMGVWFLFLLWMAFSVIGIDTSGRLVGFVYRAAIYLALTVLFVYIYNARERFTARAVGGMLTGYWLIVVAGGYLGVFFPLLAITTPLAYVLPDALLSNELVAEMAYRRVTQWDPTSFLALDPRPSAPFLYTNSWGNAYSLLLPVVAGYLISIRGERRFWWLAAAIPLSFVPAFLTLNRGMFIGLGLAALYIAFRLVLRRNLKALVALVAIGAVFGITYSVLPVEERLTSRVETSSSTEDRANLYEETWVRTLDSPLLGYGAPRPSFTPGAPSAGTQGHLWMLMFSHGLPGALLFVAFLVVLWLKTWRSPGSFGLTANTAIIVLIVELVYYGVQTSGLPIVFALGAVALRSVEDTRALELPGPGKAAG
jgi:O-antigen ligase